MTGHAALQYGPDGFDTRLKMMGRQKAGETFLKAWIDHAGADPLTGWTHSEDHHEAFVAHARALGYKGEIICASEAQFAPLERAGALWLADPAIGRFAWQRRWRAQTAWSIVGITHTMSTASAMDRVVELLTAPVQRWDALICTSRAIERAVVATLDAEADYLRARVGAKLLAGPQLPIIPLGVPCNELVRDPADRARWRQELAIANDEIAVLQFGRIALHAKAHPLALYQALAEARQRGGCKFRLIIAGQFINPRQGEMYRELATHYADVVRTDLIDGARADAGGVRSAADIGTLLADNIQESFGLAPVELMAFGLPVVASDWDGLRDTVDHGVSGFRVDTLIPPPGTGELLARRAALGTVRNDFVVGGMAQSTALDLGQAASAFHALATDPELRSNMGRAARARALAVYDWPIIIAAYRDLLDELAGRRISGEGERARRTSLTQAAQGARLDPFRNFAAHATIRLDFDLMVDRAAGAPVRIADMPGGLDMVYLVPAMLPPIATLERIAATVAGGPIRLGNLRPSFSDLELPTFFAAVGWLLKFGFLRRV